LDIFKNVQNQESEKSLEKDKKKCNSYDNALNFAFCVEKNVTIKYIIFMKKYLGVFFISL